MAEALQTGPDGVDRLALTPDGHLKLSQWDVRELQKAKGAIRTAIDILLKRLDLGPADLSRLILTGSFGAQNSVETIRDLGLIPPVSPDIVEAIPNGAGLGAAMDAGAAGGLARMTQSALVWNVPTQSLFETTAGQGGAHSPGVHFPPGNQAALHSAGQY